MLSEDWDGADYDEESDARVAAINEEWVMARLGGYLTRAVKRGLTERAEAERGPIRRHETGRPLYYETGLPEPVVSFLVRVSPMHLAEAFVPWRVACRACSETVELVGRGALRKGPFLCDRCEGRSRQLEMFAGPLQKWGYDRPLSEYYRTAHWRRLRGLKLQDHPFCTFCDRTVDLQVHHRTYVRFPWREWLEDLSVLCADHHQQYHQGEGSGR